MIDVLDDQILDLINQRLGVARRIGRLKRDGGDPVMDREREARVVDRQLRRNRGPLDSDGLRHIFTELITLCRAIQQPRTICYLGPEATFTHLAALQYFGHFPRFTPQASVGDTFREVERGACHNGVVPLDHSTEGALTSAMDLFLASNLKICAEVFLKTTFDLLSTADTLAGIGCVYAHPGTLALCLGWLKKNLPEVALEACPSSGRAALKAASEHGTAAVVGAQAAGFYGLNPLATAVEDLPAKRARFLVIGQETPQPSGNDKSSLLLAAENTPGALHRLIAPLAEAGINVLNLTATPSPRSDWDDLFFLDIEGHRSDPAIRAGLELVRKRCLYFKWLGSYPRAPEGGQPP
jgi:chorismate mutase/prephenate dehydratase